VRIIKNNRRSLCVDTGVHRPAPLQQSFAALIKSCVNADTGKGEARYVFPSETELP